MKTSTEKRTQCRSTASKAPRAGRNGMATPTELVVAYRELGFVPRRGPSRMETMRGDFVFTPPSFLPHVPYTVTTLSGV